MQLQRLQYYTGACCSPTPIAQVEGSAQVATNISPVTMAKLVVLIPVAAAATVEIANVVVKNAVGH